MTDVYAVKTLSSISTLSGALNLCHVTLRDYEKAWEGNVEIQQLPVPFLFGAKYGNQTVHKTKMTVNITALRTLSVTY